MEAKADSPHSKGSSISPPLEDAIKDGPTSLVNAIDTQKANAPKEVNLDSGPNSVAPISMAPRSMMGKSQSPGILSAPQTHPAIHPMHPNPFQILERDTTSDPAPSDSHG